METTVTDDDFTEVEDDDFIEDADADEGLEPQHEDEDEDDQDAGDDVESDDEPVDGADEDEPTATGRVIVTLDGDDDVSEDDYTPGYRAMRKANREHVRKIKELEAKLAEQEQPADIEPGERPRLEDFDYDETRHADALISWHERKRQHDAKQEADAIRKRQHDEAWAARVGEYETQKRDFGAADFDDAEAAVQSVLSPNFAGAILDAAEDPAKVIYYLGNNEAKLAELAELAEANQVKFIAAVARLEGNLTVRTTRTKPKPEPRIKGGGQAAVSADKKLERLRADAEKTGDFSKVTAYRRKLARS